MSISEKERGDTIKTTWETKSGGTYADVTNPTVTVYKSDGSKLIDAESPTKTGTGQYEHYFHATSTDPLGLYVIAWEATHDVAGQEKPIVNRKLISIIDAKQT